MKPLAISASLYVAAACLSPFGQVSPVASEIGPWAQLGTAGVLAWVVSLLVGEQRASRADAVKQREEFNTAFAAASDRWHEESAKTQGIMMEMVQQCAAARRTAADLAEKTAVELLDRQRLAAAAANRQ